MIEIDIKYGRMASNVGYKVDPKLVTSGKAATEPATDSLTRPPVCISENPVQAKFSDFRLMRKRPLPVIVCCSGQVIPKYSPNVSLKWLPKTSVCICKICVEKDALLFHPRELQLVGYEVVSCIISLLLYLVVRRLGMSLVLLNLIVYSIVYFMRE